MITLETPSGALDVSIGGITMDFASPRGTIEISRELYKRYWHDSQATRFFIDLEADANKDSVQQSISSQLGRDYRLRILHTKGLVEYFAEQVRRAFAPINVLTILIAIVILLGMVDTLGATVADRKVEVGIIRALGMRSEKVQLIVLFEAARDRSDGDPLGSRARASPGLALGTQHLPLPHWLDSELPYPLGENPDLHAWLCRHVRSCGAPSRTGSESNGPRKRPA